ncbi:heme peroxidase [Exidia glandulosa HHB12029]|uniref:Peroxidase n=1 Tax=Exidia glandulosa HHB12029 TaxID=1314781 RepID=A0A165ZDD8_EXIGL|nr:heme peroxidase [Exidia glandulosa HHB12029]
MLPVSLLVLAVVGLSDAYTWPNRQMEKLDQLRYEQLGVNAHIATFVSPCDRYNFDFTSQKQGRTNSADWLRTAYHDMATYNVEDGTGGLDASIQFVEEQSRAENTGNAFANTITFARILAGRHTSLADGVALVALMAIEQCYGPEIDFRAGRIDATEPNNPGVPEPQDSLESHTASFARQGFTPTEMIQLVACGHSLGGVQHDSFPDIVPPTNDPDNNASGNVHFDSTFDNFDNKIATDYVSGQTTNPLIVGQNETTRSDLRIFSSDGNVTMNAFAASNDFFMKTCGSILTRMLDTVPRGVKLTEVVKPLPVRPDQFALLRTANDSLSLKGRFRFWNINEEDANRKVTLFWADSQGQQCQGCSVDLAYNGRTTNWLPYAPTVLWYQLPSTGQLIRPDLSISKFWFQITESNGRITVEDQGGIGYPLQTDVLLTDEVCFDGGALYVSVSVRKSLNPSRVFLEGDAFDENGTSIPNGLAIRELTRDAAASAQSDAYDILRITLDNFGDAGAAEWNVAWEVDGQQFSDPGLFTGVSFLSFGGCPGAA